MAITITIRNVPEAVHDELAARAARAGQSLQEYMLARVGELAEQVTVDVLLRRVRERKAATGTHVSAEEIVAWRDADRR